jgi:hypothetical protein
MVTREVLLLLSDMAAAQKMLDRAPEGYRIISVFPPRMAVVEIVEPELEKLRRDPGVRLVVEDAAPEEVFDELTEGEKFFLNGWLLKRTSPEKKRAGDGLAWDTSGFLPPDPPSDLR